VTATVSLRGGGQPYVLDAWTGQVTPIANYTDDGGRLTVTVTLAPQDATIIETSPSGSGLHATSISGGQLRFTDGHQMALRVTQAGDYSVSLSNGKTDTVHVDSVPAAVDLSTGWNLALESWGPDPTATDQTIAAKTTTMFAANALGTWASLPATSAQLAALGVSSMSQVSGIGRYSTTFQLPASWNAGADGALLSFTHGNGDMVVAVTVNGHTIDTVDQATSTVDAGPYLQAGANTIEVKMDTNLGNRVGRATQTYGLTGVSFQPYTETAVP